MRIARTLAVLSLGWILLGCSSDPATSPVPPGDGGAGGTAGAPAGGAGGEGGEGGAPAADPCDAEALASPSADTVYFVAVNEPGADNDACDGLAAEDMGGGHCPFKDLSSPDVRALLGGGADTRIELREGTYLVEGWDGLSVHGTGTTDDEPLVLTAYPGEHPVIDVPDPDGSGCLEGDPTQNPDCVRQVIRVSGTHTVVQGLTIQNGLAYDLEVNGGAHHTVQCNHFTYTAEFDQRSDQVKLDGEATDILVRLNEFTGWRSQAIDMTDVSAVVIEENDFHDPLDADGGATGTKFGSSDVVIRNNDVHDLGSDPTAHAFSLGGTGSPHDDDYAAEEVHVVGNRLWNIAGKVAQVVSCRGCSVEGNVATDVGYGVLLSASGSATVGECTTAPDQTCLPSTGVRIEGNRLTLTGDVFVVMEADQATDFVAADNVYCATSVGAASFGWQVALTDPIEQVAFEEWLALSGTDAGSVVLPTTDAGCRP